MEPRHARPEGTPGARDEGSAAERRAAGAVEALPFWGAPVTRGPKPPGPGSAELALAAWPGRARKGDADRRRGRGLMRRGVSVGGAEAES